MAKALNFDSTASSDLVAEARDFLFRATALLTEANCPSAAAMATAAARRATQAVRKKKTLLIDTFSGRD